MPSLVIGTRGFVDRIDQGGLVKRRFPGWREHDADRGCLGLADDELSALLAIADLQSDFVDVFVGGIVDAEIGEG
ncbi:hypothetical protein ACFFX0_25985 [Citricoccus parietis]|uniref:Uncharacterized protein n=1 Tax=Citricoccus parietis TaxID=592307 RepID=A0ABV5G6C3_9MICC